MILKTQLEESIISGVVLLFDKFENEKIIWENKFLPDIIDFSGSMCTPFSLDIDMLTGQLFFTKNRLNDFADVYETKFRLFRELKLPELKSIANAELAEIFSFKIPSNTIINQTHLTCKLCNLNISNDLMRSHVASHILNKDKNIIQDENLCGFCGTVCGNFISIIKGTGSSSFTSSTCDYNYKISLQNSKKSSQRNPSSNFPVICKICQQIIWLYNMEYHFSNKHSNLNFID